VPADLILLNGRFTTLDRANPNPQAVAISDGRFHTVADAQDVIADTGAQTRVIDLQGRRVVPGLIDSHMHIIRGGLNYNMELRWDGVRSLGCGCARGCGVHGHAHGKAHAAGVGERDQQAFWAELRPPDIAEALARRGFRPFSWPAV